jgi:putative membrane protein
MNRAIATIAIAFALSFAACMHSSAGPSATVPLADGSTGTSVAPPSDPGPAQASSAREIPGDPNDKRLADNAPAPTESQPTLSDDQILGVTHTANAGEIEQGRLAMTKAHDARVKALAADMVKDHNAAESKGASLATKAGLKPSPSPTSDQLQSDAEGATRSLKSETGSDFDKSYVDAQVREHQAVLDAIDQKLLPNARAADLKAYLQEVRTTVSRHLDHAKELQQELQQQK